MQKLARIAIQRRWLVIVAWLAFIILTQAISGGLGGANYKDTFSLPHTETDKVVKLLKASGQDNQNGLSGQVVMHAKSGDLQAAPNGVLPQLQKLCNDNLDVVSVTSPWQSYSCSPGGGGTQTAAEPTQLSKDKTIAIVNVNWHSNKYDQKLFDGVYDNLKGLNSSNLQVEFTGDGFQGQGQKESGVPPVLLGFIAALIILGIVFRTIGADGNAAGQRRCRLVKRPWFDRHAQPRDERLERDAATDRTDGHRCRRRLRVVHRHAGIGEICAAA